MIEKLMRWSGILVLYGAASLFFAMLLLGAYVKYAWRIDGEKIARIFAVAQGFDVQQTEDKIREAWLRETMDITRQDILDQRAMRDRNLELQGKAASEALGQIAIEEAKNEKIKKEIAAMLASFQEQLKKLQEESQSKGITELTEIIGSIEPELARQYILDMITNAEYARVIMILKGLEPRRRSRIINVFQLEDELKSMAGILRRIGNGEPDATLVNDMKKLAGEKKPPQETRNGT
ncbi:MAG: hypothetical protein FWC50_07565 [Planctomycetaceae bacterium]|nr:hypothetical protein [Planctomycetaceae bacterium]